MNVIYIIGGCASLAIGIYLTVKQVKVFMKGEQDNQGFDVKALGLGIMIIMTGLYLIFKYL